MDTWMTQQYGDILYFFVCVGFYVGVVGHNTFLLRGMLSVKLKNGYMD